jgi:hypothetical protein
MNVEYLGAFYTAETAPPGPWDAATQAAAEAAAVEQAAQLREQEALIAQADQVDLDPGHMQVIPADQVDLDPGHMQVIPADQVDLDPGHTQAIPADQAIPVDFVDQADLVIGPEPIPVQPVPAGFWTEYGKPLILVLAAALIFRTVVR